MTARELETRTKKIAIFAIQFIEPIATHGVSRILSAQLIRCATSIGANYREANRAESKRDFIHKIAIIEKEAAESQYWLELVHECSLGDPNEVRALLKEAGELLAIFTRIGRTAKRSLNSQFAIRNSQSPS